ncbi:hypothetical protein N7467_010723 [Penicillium canescens]|nr:hypothetical protein N7467_010723 [Penicillium canescens]
MSDTDIASWKKFCVVLAQLYPPTNIADILAIMGAADQLRLSRSVPRLKGKSNWMSWSERLFVILKDISPVYLEILTGRYRCPIPLTGEGVTKEDQAKQKARIAAWKADSYRVRVYLGSTLADEPASHVKDIYDTHEAYQKLEAQFAEKKLMSGSRCWSEWTKLKYDHSEITALEFVRQFQQAIFQLKMTQRSGLGPKQQLPQFMQAINIPGFATFLASIDPDFDSTDLMEIAYASFIQFVQSGENPDLAVFRRVTDPLRSDMAKKPVTTDKAPPAANSLENTDKGKKRPSEGSSDQVVRKPRLNDEARKVFRMTTTGVVTPRPLPSDRSAPSSQSNYRRAGSPLFVTLDSSDEVGDDGGLPLVIDENALDSAARS